MSVSSFSRLRTNSFLCTALLLMSGCTEAQEPEWNSAAKCSGLAGAIGTQESEKLALQFFDYAIKKHPSFTSNKLSSVAEVNFVKGHSQGSVAGLFMVGSIEVKIEGKVINSPKLLAEHYMATNGCEPLINEIANTTKQTTIAEKTINQQNWRPLTKEVITNGAIVVKADSRYSTIEFEKPLNYPSLWVDGIKVVYSQQKSEYSIRSNMPIFVYFQYGNTLEIRHENGVETYSLQGWTSTWKQADGYVSTKRPQWHIDKFK